ncbi:hypothetical protein [Roseibium algae]|uniref:Motility protein YjfB-like n=1 Tax=Roseibium algae TaxID=3123038 RepID=A0ABU8TL63_9HYPH
MDSVGIATTFAATSQAQTGMALQNEMMKMAAATEASVVDLLESGAQSLQAAGSTSSAPPPGLGGSVDVSV